MNGQDSLSFSPRTVTLIIAVGIFAFAGAALFSIFSGSTQNSGANSFSKSAIGHAAFVELLGAQNIPVIVSRNNSSAKSDARTLLIVAEPPPGKSNSDDAIPMADRTLLILPKRRGIPDPRRPAWIAHAVLIPKEPVEKTMSAFFPDATLNRPDSEVAWKKTSLSALHVIRPGQLGNDLLWSRIRSHTAPAIDQPQFLKSEKITPIIASAEGILVGATKRDDRWLFVISDPDLLANHGIGKADNAALTLDLLSLFRPANGSIIIDETVHGFRSNPNLWRQAFELPFLVSTILTVTAVLILLGAATGRFGAPLPPDRQRRESETGLIENAADLLQGAGHGTAIVRRYPAVALRAVAQRLHAPRGLSPLDLIAWVDRVGTARGVKTRYRPLQDEIENAASQQNANDNRVLHAVLNLYQWKQEILNGPGRNSGR